MPEQDMPRDSMPTIQAAAPRAGFTLTMPMAVVIGAIIIGLCLIVGLSRGGSSAAAGTQATAQQPANTADIKDVNTSGEPFIGQANAPVVMAFWSDWQ